MLIRRKVPIAIERYVLNGAILGLLALLYAPLLWHWVDGWLNKSISTEHEYFSHGLIGLPFAAYIAWNQRNEWRRLPEANHPLGIAFLSLGAVFYLSGLSDLVNLSLPAILVGLCLWLKGLPGLKLQGFPLILVFLATPTELPYLIAPYTLPLQHFIAAIAGFILNQFGMDVTVEQIYLYVGDRIVEVAPYCAGLKMLFTSLYVGLMLVYWTGTWTSRTKTSLFFLGTVVISVSANILRNTLLTFFHGTSQEKAFEWLHAGWGGDLYSACMLGLTVLLLTKIDQFFSSNPESDGAEGVAE
ncbi:cyanoexosortase B [Trichocoleus sp. FACHB-591]|uniref:cyanoexosortase B n=1 Tax=Trichocoleus sp. FACHB-591 TaxID=2692872 RepID=UPI001687D434|nr:cyanoexosortase B [Trichocoleus sp. FACHB-591]MBD2098240.1 cyanoexosortase B [Trichocoleus sp. FACHB-591]